MKSMGQIAYEAYAADTEWKSLVSGAPLPQWESLAPAIQKAWSQAAAAVINAMDAEISPDEPEEGP